MPEEQQDASEFFDSLCEKSVALSSCVFSEQTMITKCPQLECDYVRLAHANDKCTFILVFPLNPNEITYQKISNPVITEEYTIQNSVEYNLNSTGNMQFCENCGKELIDTFQLRINNKVAIFF